MNSETAGISWIGKRVEFSFSFEMLSRSHVLESNLDYLDVRKSERALENSQSMRNLRFSETSEQFRSPINSKLIQSISFRNREEEWSKTTCIIVNYL